MKTLSVAALLVIATLMAGCSQESTQQKAPAEPQPVAQTKPQPVPKTEAQSLPQTPPKPEPQPAPKRQAQPAPKQELARDGNWSGEGVNLTIQFVVTNRGTIVRDLSVSTRGLQLTGPNEGMVSLRGTTYPGEYPIVGSKFAVPGGAVAATFLSSTNAEGTAESTPWKGGIQP